MGTDATEAVANGLEIQMFPHISALVIFMFVQPFTSTPHLSTAGVYVIFENVMLYSELDNWNCIYRQQ